MKNIAKKKYTYWNETMPTRHGFLAKNLKFGDYFLVNVIDRGHLTSLFIPHETANKKCVVAQILKIQKKDNSILIETDICKELVLKPDELICYTEVTCLPSKTQIAIAKNLSKY